MVVQVCLSWNPVSWWKLRKLHTSGCLWLLGASSIWHFFGYVSPVWWLYLLLGYRRHAHFLHLWYRQPGLVAPDYLFPHHLYPHWWRVIFFDGFCLHPDVRGTENALPKLGLYKSTTPGQFLDVEGEFNMLIEHWISWKKRNTCITDLKINFMIIYQSHSIRVLCDFCKLCICSNNCFLSSQNQSMQQVFWQDNEWRE